MTETQGAAGSVRVSLASWLLAQIDADEAAVKPKQPVIRLADHDERWDTPCLCGKSGDLIAVTGFFEDGQYEFVHYSPSDDGGTLVERHVFEFGEQSFTEESVEHLPPKRFSPARVLAECAARRKIIELHSPFSDSPENIERCVTCGDDYVDEPWPCRTLRLLAAPYATEPGYRAEWAVSP